ncbi:MAG: hypothetical protein PHI98_15540 [Eubacteriales bacterium]|nr:hypothetical protein [Eubacteriales bacterium]
MKSKRSLLIRITTVVVLLLIAGAMFIVGRGHTIYIDNKTLEYDGQTYSAAHRAEIFVNGEKIAKLSKRERGMATCMGQSFTMEVTITQDKGDEPKTYTITQQLPYSMDGIVINLPGYLAGLSEEAYLTPFVSMATTTEDEEAPTEDDLMMDEGMGAEDLSIPSDI